MYNYKENQDARNNDSSNNTSNPSNVIYQASPSNHDTTFRHLVEFWEIGAVAQIAVSHKAINIAISDRINSVACNRFSLSGSIFHFINTSQLGEFMNQKFVLSFQDDKPITNWKAITNYLRTVLNKNSLNGLYFEMTVKKIRQAKTFSQLGYFHAELLWKIITGYKEAGYSVPLGIAGEKWAKEQIKTLDSIRFIESVENVLTGEIVTNFRSFADATKEEMSNIIDVCIRNYGEYFGILFVTPKEYKEKLKKWEK